MSLTPRPIFRAYIVTCGKRASKDRITVRTVASSRRAALDSVSRVVPFCPASAMTCRALPRTEARQ